MSLRRTIAILCLLLALPGQPERAQAQPAAPCGVVDAIDYPVDVSDTYGQRYDDFALYRPRFFGNHVGIDIGFNRWGDPVRAAARGRVTLANLEEWDTEKGVVVLEHVFPDGSLIYTVYGHMEVGETVFFPTVGACVERGEVIGLIGWPSRGLPHLHYEIRTMLPGEGGPGYVEGSPLEAGWLHPFDFTELWRARLQPGFVQARTFREVPALPPIALEDGVTVVAGASGLTGYQNGAAAWQITLPTGVTGLAPLSGGRVAAQARDGQVIVLQGSRFSAVWASGAPEAPMLAAGDMLFFAGPGGELAAYSDAGARLWQQAASATSGSERVLDLQADGQTLAMLTRSQGITHWRLVSTADGAPMLAQDFRDSVAMAPAASGGWLLLNGAALWHAEQGALAPAATLSPAAGRTARLVSSVGSVFIYAGDADATLLALDDAGALRWRVDYPHPLSSIAPLMAVGSGCLLYTLDADGMLNIFRGSDGALLAQRHLYAGGLQTGSPRARLLQVSADERVWAGGGFLSIVQFDGRALAPEAAAACGG